MTSPAPIRILIVDDHALVREALRLLIAQHSRFLVVGDAGSGEAAKVLARDAAPDVILLDLDLGADDGLDLIPALRAAAPKASLLVLTGVRDPHAHTTAMVRGAQGVVLKDHAGELLLKAIEKVHLGETWLDRARMSQVLSELVGRRRDAKADLVATLTPREREIIALVAEGLKNEQIAGRLFISDKTVRNHLTSIFDKLGVNDRLELAVFAHRYDLLQVTT